MNDGMACEMNKRDLKGMDGNILQAISGDFNVTLNPNEHSSESSFVTNDMMEFKEYVCNAVKEFFSFGKLLGELNTTIISLIPKISTPLMVNDFRPIAYCNVLYKCISEVITEKIKGCLDKLINMNQSAFIPVFFGSINEDEQKILLSILPFIKGNLPTRYLGVPLISKRLGVKDCKSLIDKVNSKINHWRNKFLTYAGKLQLIVSILEAIYSYWCFVFLLSKTVVKAINRIPKNFLWSQSDVSKGQAKVAWKAVCKPKSLGGLGLKDLMM
nr:RNA-directed DNA polymerase, eukaryota, reverse transcriptase zinc-binding domain protein [Tanacetum cinerariifolium]